MQTLHWCIYEIDTSDLNNLKFHHQHDEVAMDEKLFTEQQLKKNVKTLPDHPYVSNNTCQHKSHIGKVMFTCAVCEPSENCNGNRGIIIHAHEETAKRNSINRPRGTIELVLVRIGS